MPVGVDVLILSLPGVGPAPRGGLTSNSIRTRLLRKWIDSPAREHRRRRHQVDGAGAIAAAGTQGKQEYRWPQSRISPHGQLWTRRLLPISHQEPGVYQIGEV